MLTLFRYRLPTFRLSQKCKENCIFSYAEIAIIQNGNRYFVAVTLPSRYLTSAVTSRYPNNRTIA